MPLGKIGRPLFLWRQTLCRKPVPGPLLRTMEYLGKWSLLDVFVLALTIFAIKARPLVHVEVGMAIYPSVGAIFLGVYAARVIAIKQAHGEWAGDRRTAASQG